MNLQTFVSAQNDSSFTDINGTEYYAKAADTLRTIGVLSGYQDGSFGAKRNVTRAEMAAIICRFMGAEQEALYNKGYTTELTKDVSADHWASGYVVLSVDRGIISGDGNGLFRPNDNVKFEEAIKMIVCASKLDGRVEHNSQDWSAGYIETANLFGIVDNVMARKGEYVNRGDIAQMIYQALDCNHNGPQVSVESGTYDTTQYVDMWVEGDADIYYAKKIVGQPRQWEKYDGYPVEISEPTELHTVAKKNGIVISSTQVYIYDFTDNIVRGNDLYELSLDYNTSCVKREM